MEKRRAKTLFMEVSIDNPASTIAQGAQIALACIKESDTPEGLLLLDNPDDLDDIVRAANYSHKNIVPERQPIELDQTRVAAIIRRDHYVAQQFLEAGLTQSQLREILSLYRNATHEGIRGISRERLLAELIEHDYGVDLSTED